MEDIEIYKNKEAIYYYKKGTSILHNLNGPAIESVDGNRSYWVDGERHRTDGPAMEIITSGYYEWWINGVRLSVEKEKLLNIWYENKLAFERKV